MTDLKRSMRSDNPLNGKHIVFLGSSVTYGAASNGVSFVDFLAERTGCRVTKDVVLDKKDPVLSYGKAASAKQEETA